MKKILLSLAFILLANTHLNENGTVRASKLTLSPRLAFSNIEQAPHAAPKLGSEKNPLILALGSSFQGVVSPQSLAAQLELLSGYHFMNLSPTSSMEIVQAFKNNQLHIAILSPYEYLHVRHHGVAQAVFAVTRNGEAFYGAQFIARSDSDFTSYFDPIRGVNTADAAQALAQFNGKKPCWSDVTSLSGYVIPLGFLNQAHVQTRAPAFLEGQGPVVRAVYADDICDFGATFMDARRLPTLEADYPDVLEKVEVIWRIPPIIPYETVSLASGLPAETREALMDALLELMNTEQAAESLQLVEDHLYDEFERYVKASGLIADE